jgi:hypothetical protein
MKWIWASGVCLSLGCLATSASAQGVTWRPAPQRHIDPRVEAAASIGPPRPVEDATRHDPNLAPAAFVVPTPGALLPWVKAQQGERQQPPPAEPGHLPASLPEPAQAVAKEAPARRPLLAASFPTGPAMAPEGAVIWDTSGNGEGMPCDCFEEAALDCHRFEFSAEYLLWWTRGNRLPPLVTTGPVEVPEAVRGALGAPGTVLLFGNTDAYDETRSGGRFTVGYWHDPTHCLGLEASFFFLQESNTNFGASSDQFPVLARPFFNLNFGIQTSELLATPLNGFLDLRGRVDIDASSRLWGAEINAKRALCILPCSPWRFEVLGGFRYLDLEENLSITEQSVSLAAVPDFPVFDVGNQLRITDSFDTHNRFYGGQVGGRVEWRRGPWAVEGRAKVALGVTHQEVDINGSLTVSPVSAPPQVFTGGLLALSSNIGSYSRERFSVVPEVGVKVYYQLTPEVRVFGGYDFLLWTNVARPGDQVDTNVDLNLLPTQPASGGTVPNLTGRTGPLFPFRDTTYWAQGINVGVEVRY